MSDSSKPWFKSKTIWAGVVTSLIAAIKLAIALGVDIPPEVVQFLESLIGSGLLAAAGGAAIYGRVRAEKRIGR